MLLYFICKIYPLQLSVIIVNYNVKYFLEQCLVSVINACSNIEAEILVIDNCSTDGSRAFFKDKFSEVTFIWQTENAGFSRANNFALKKAGGEVILFLNPDTLLPKDCLTACLNFYKTQAGIGALGIHMIDGSGQFLKESKRGIPSPITSMFKLIGWAALFPCSPLFARYYLGHLPETINDKVEVLSGAFMMVSKKVLNITGGFDEAFFMYGEDIDLSYRIEKAGFSNFYFADCSIIHFKGESTQKQSRRYTEVFYGAMELFVKKHYPAISAFAFTVLIKTAIVLKLTIAKLKYWVGHKNGVINIASSVSIINTLIVANEKDYTFISAVLNSTNANYTIIGRICNNELTANAIGTIANLPTLIYQFAIDHVVFCSNGSAIKSNIEVMRQLELTATYSFYLTGTSSILGSSNKNKTGYYIEL